MGFRFRKRIKIMPGLSLNIGKRGTSLTVGGRGAHVTVGKRGSTTTVGLPGTGLFYSEHTPASHHHQAPPQTLPAPQKQPWSTGGILVLVMIVIILAAIVLQAILKS